VNPGQPSSEAVRQQIGGDPRPTPGQLTLPGMPSPAEVVGGQATLPGLEFHTADGPHRVDDRRFHGQVNVAIVERHLWDRYKETVAVEAR
jgi:hypothetical protein